MGRSLTLVSLLVLGATIFAASDLVAGASALSLPAPRPMQGPVSPGALLVVGGVLTMGGVLAVMGARSVLPGSPSAPAGESRRVHTEPRLARGTGDHAYRGPRDEEFGRGFEVGQRLPAGSMDDLFDQMVQREVGEPRLVRSMRGFLRLRLHGCRGCAGAGPDHSGCAFECGLLEAGLARALGRDVLVHEVACAAKGAPACEFEVWH